MGDRRSDVRLAWVVWDGRDAHINEFAGFQDTERPAVTCPECEQELTLRLGGKRAWHAAHKADAACALTAPESALHYNAKMLVARELRGLTELTVAEVCPGAHGYRSPDCAGSRSRVLASDWTRVEVERRVASRRPDVVLLRDSAAVAAIEIWVHHRVDEQKRQDLAAEGLPWGEVDVDEGFVEGAGAWSADCALPLVAAGPDTQWCCDACVRFRSKQLEALAERQHLAAEAEARRAAAAERLMADSRLRQEEAERGTQEREGAAKEARTAFSKAAKSMLRRLQTDGTVFRRLRIFDVLRPHGSVHRDGFVVADVYRSGERVGAFAGVLGSLEVLHKVAASAGPIGYVELAERCEHHLQARRRDGSHVDPSSWFPMLQVLDNTDFLNGWTWEGKDHRWPRGRELSNSPWVPSWSAEGVDCLDLARFLFVRYFSGLPVRWRWSEQKREWFLPKVESEEPWRLWPE